MQPLRSMHQVEYKVNIKYLPKTLHKQTKRASKDFIQFSCLIFLTLVTSVGANENFLK